MRAVKIRLFLVYRNIVHFQLIFYINLNVKSQLNNMNVYKRRVSGPFMLRENYHPGLRRKLLYCEHYFREWQSDSIRGHRNEDRRKIAKPSAGKTINSRASATILFREDSRKNRRGSRFSPHVCVGPVGMGKSLSFANNSVREDFAL